MEIHYEDKEVVLGYEYENNVTLTFEELGELRILANAIGKTISGHKLEFNVIELHHWRRLIDLVNDPDNQKFFGNPGPSYCLLEAVADKLERLIALEKNTLKLRSERAVDSICDMVQDAVNDEFFNFPLPGTLKTETAEVTLARLLGKHHARKSRR